MPPKVKTTILEGKTDVEVLQNTIAWLDENRENISESFIITTRRYKGGIWKSEIVYHENPGKDVPTETSSSPKRK